MPTIESSPERANAAAALFEEAIAWLRSSYSGFHFFTERDVVWTFQLRLQELVETRADRRWTVFNDHTVANRRRTDLALVAEDQTIDLAAEFKYEPAHSRSDIVSTKFPVCFWDDQGIAKDVDRAREYVTDGSAAIAYAVLVDEGGHFRHREPPPGSRWIDWPEADGVSVLCARFPVR